MAAEQRGSVGVDVCCAAGLYPVTHSVPRALIFSLSRETLSVCVCMCVCVCACRPSYCV